MNFCWSYCKNKNGLLFLWHGVDVLLPSALTLLAGDKLVKHTASAISRDSLVETFGRLWSNLWKTGQLNKIETTTTATTGTTKTRVELRPAVERRTCCHSGTSWGRRLLWKRVPSSRQCQQCQQCVRHYIYSYSDWQVTIMMMMTMMMY